jgi:hypothetical protein
MAYIMMDEETLGFKDPVKVMSDFDAWIQSVCKDKPVFISNANQALKKGTPKFPKGDFSRLL